MEHRSFRISRSYGPRITRRISSPDSVRWPTCTPSSTEGPMLRIFRYLRHIGTTPSSQGAVNGARHRPFKVRGPRNRLPQRSHSTEKQVAIRSQIDSLLALRVIEESRASYWSQLHMVRKPTPGEWRMTLDFVQLNTATRGLEGWPIPNIQQNTS